MPPSLRAIKSPGAEAWSRDKQRPDRALYQLQAVGKFGSAEYRQEARNNAQTLEAVFDHFTLQQERN